MSIHSKPPYCIYSWGHKLQFEWDEANKGHIAIHGVTTKEVEDAFSRPVYEIPGSHDEPRNLCVGPTARGESMAKSSSVTNKIYKIPQFKSEAEEAEWWYANRERLGDLLVKHGRMVRKVVEPTQTISIRIPEADLNLARQLAKKQGVGYQIVLKRAIRDGLQKAN